MSEIIICDGCGLNKLDACHCVCESERDRLKAELEAQEKKYERYLHNLRDDWKVDAEEKDAHCDLWKGKAEKLAEALMSISKNSCCKPCREAGLVAKEALAAYEKEDK